jgi:hypothetical protein
MSDSARCLPGERNSSLRCLLAVLLGVSLLNARDAPGLSREPGPRGTRTRAQGAAGMAEGPAKQTVVEESGCVQSGCLW